MRNFKHVILLFMEVITLCSVDSVLIDLVQGLCDISGLNLLCWTPGPHHINLLAFERCSCDIE